MKPKRAKFWYPPLRDPEKIEELKRAAAESPRAVPLDEDEEDWSERTAFLAECDQYLPYELEPFVTNWNVTFPLEEIAPALAPCVSEISTPYRSRDYSPEHAEWLLRRLRSALGAENASMAAVLAALQVQGYGIHRELEAHAAWVQQHHEKTGTIGVSQAMPPADAEKLAGIGRRVVDGGKKGGDRRSGVRKVRNITQIVAELDRRIEKAARGRSSISKIQIRRQVARDYGISLSTLWNYEQEVRKHDLH